MIIKVCGITRQEDVESCLALGVDWLGFIFHPSSPRFISPQAAARLRTGKAKRVGVCVKQSLEEINALMDQAGLDLVQLHGDQSEETCRRLGSDRVIKVFWPERFAGRKGFEAELSRFTGAASTFLFDAGRTGGGSGAPISAAWLGQLVSPRPWLLAGGLGPDTIRMLLRACRPQGVDLNTGVEASPGLKDDSKLKQTLEAIKGVHHA
jgi:phosphoribosylanthranilate isomerase